MYAIVDIAGQQFKVEKEQKLYVHRLDGNEDSKVSFDSVLLIDNDGKVTLGKPVIDGARVSAKILTHVKGDKVLVFKKKRRKGYKTLNGHRQLFTQIQIAKIEENPLRAGVPGAILGFVQSMLGITADTAAGIASVVGVTIEELPGISQDDIEKLGGFFDPSLPEMEIYENTIALELAKLRILSGGQGIRALTTAFEDAKRDVDIAGFFDSRTVLARLNAVRREMVTERTKLLRRAFNQSTKPGPVPTVIPEFSINLDTLEFERVN